MKLVRKRKISCFERNVGLCIFATRITIHRWYIVFNQQEDERVKIKAEKLFEELRAVAEQMGIQVIIDKGNFRGGYCLVYTEKKIVLNKMLPPEGKAAKLAESLKHFPLDELYIKPALREYLEMTAAPGKAIMTKVQPATSITQHPE